MKNFRLPLAILFLVINFNVQASGGGGAPPSNYLALNPPFVVNVTDGSKVRHAEVRVQLKLSDPSLTSIVEQHKPAIQHEMVMLLSGRPVSEVGNVQGREAIRKESLAVLQKFMQENTGKPVVEAVYFTGFIIQ